MKGKTAKRTTRLIFILAVLSFLIATAQGIIYYRNYEPFFKLLLVLQNSINAFGFKATVTIKDAVAFMKDNPSLVTRSVGYAYCLAVFTAPYCTISFMYKFLENILRLIIGFRRGKNCRHIVVFGFNDDVRSMLKKSTTDPKKVCIHIITTESVPQDELYALNKSGHMIHNIDALKAADNELESLFARTHISEATNIILFENSSIRNFSLLQLFRLNDSDTSYRIDLAPGAKVSLRCEEEGIGRLIAEYYDSCAGNGALFDLEVVSFPEMQISRMYSEMPLHYVHEKAGDKLDDWNVHLLVVGLGQLGQQAVIQAMNLGVVTGKNSIVIDVFDTNIKAKMADLIDQFSPDSFAITDKKLTLRPEVADGVMEVNFHPLNVHHLDFYQLMRKKASESPYTYAVIALEDIDTAVHCALKLEEVFQEKSREIPIMMRMDSDRRLAGYISSENNSLANVHLIDDRSCVITLDMIIRREIDRKAKEFNHLYNNIAIITQDETGTNDNANADAEQEWNRLKLFRRSSSRAAACHESVKAVIIPRLAAECGQDTDEVIKKLIGTDGILMKFTGSAWRMNGSEEEVLDRMKADNFAYTLATLEHRRWCCYMASIGWRCGERSDKFRRNPCLVTQEELMKKRPEMCKYDLMSIMARYKKQ